MPTHTTPQAHMKACIIVCCMVKRGRKGSDVSSINMLLMRKVDKLRVSRTNKHQQHTKKSTVHRRVCKRASNEVKSRFSSLLFYLNEQEWLSSLHLIDEMFIFMVFWIHPHLIFIALYLIIIKIDFNIPMMIFNMLNSQIILIQCSIQFFFMTF